MNDQELPTPVLNVILETHIVQFRIILGDPVLRTLSCNAWLFAFVYSLATLAVTSRLHQKQLQEICPEARSQTNLFCWRAQLAHMGIWQILWYSKDCRDIHALGVCHYDLKPCNLIKTPSGSKVFIDFGASDINCDSDKLTREMELFQSRYHVLHFMQSVE